MHKKLRWTINQNCPQDPPKKRQSRWTIEIVYSIVNDFNPDDLTYDTDTKLFCNILATEKNIDTIIKKAFESNKVFILHFPKTYYQYKFSMPAISVVHVNVYRESKRSKNIIKAAEDIISKYGYPSD